MSDRSKRVRSRTRVYTTTGGLPRANTRQFLSNLRELLISLFEVYTHVLASSRPPTLVPPLASFLPASSATPALSQNAPMGIFNDSTGPLPPRVWNA